MLSWQSMKGMASFIHLYKQKMNNINCNEA
jgi:hypothetical protein